MLMLPGAVSATLNLRSHPEWLPVTNMNSAQISSSFAPSQRLRLFRAAAVALCAFCFAALPAMAQAASNPTSAQYRNTTAQINEDVGGGGTHLASTSALREEVGGLPFTGLDLLTLAAVAAALVSAGLALRWLTTDHRRHP